MNVLILGGGAAGMAAAIFASQNGHRVTLLERQSRVGRKLLATGNGRCNLTNLRADETHYHGDGSFIASVLRTFPAEKTLAWFHDLGLYTVAEPSGRVYPLSDRAATVVDTLRFALEDCGVLPVCGCEVTRLRPKARAWQATAADGSVFSADCVIVAAGGCAGSALGGTKGGYRLLSDLGHTVTGLFPSLVQVRTDTALVRALKGVRADAALTLKTPHGALARSSGEVQFTDFGVSGPAVFDLSRAVSVSEGESVLLLDLLREVPEDALAEELCARAEGVTCERLLSGMLHPRLSQAVLKAANLDPAAPADETLVRRTAHAVKYFPLTVCGTLGMDHAQVTAGGVRTSEFRADTLESRLRPGLFACGEVLDVDGDCGGYNLQWAWSSAFVAAGLGKRGDGE